ncbi:MAG: hypothetical protein ACQETD_09730 [Pseudomonadota bacterium]
MREIRILLPRVVAFIGLLGLLSACSDGNPLSGEDAERTPPVMFHGPFSAAEVITYPTGSDPSLLVEYGEAIEPTLFEATLDDQSVTTHFYPEPGKKEQVKLPFEYGKDNRLTITAVNKGGELPVRRQWTIRFSEVGVVPFDNRQSMSRAEMARLDKLMQMAEEKNIPPHKRGEFLRRKGFPLE